MLNLNIWVLLNNPWATLMMAATKNDVLQTYTKFHSLLMTYLVIFLTKTNNISYNFPVVHPGHCMWLFEHELSTNWKYLYQISLPFARYFFALGFTFSLDRTALHFIRVKKSPPIIGRFKPLEVKRGVAQMKTAT